jgi:hypothetical protein
VIAAVSNGAWMARGAEEAFRFRAHRAGDARPDPGYRLDRSSRSAASHPFLRKDELTGMANDKTLCWLSKEADKGPGGPCNRVHKNRVVGAFHNGSSFMRLRVSVLSGFNGEWMTTKGIYLWILIDRLNSGRSKLQKFDTLPLPAPKKVIKRIGTR